MKTKIYEPSKVAKRSYWSIVNGSAKISLLEGAVRSSKTYTSNSAALRRIQNIPACDVLVSGTTSGSVARNVVAEWIRILGRWRFTNRKDGKDEYMTINYPGLSNKKFYVRGSSKANDADQIQGATYGFWLGDEITNCHETFVNMADSRLSLPFSTAAWSTNPDSPLHYIKEKWRDNVDFIEKDIIKTFHFTLDDNPSLTEEYKEGLRLRNHGVFYDRYILGKWVKAEGLVYPNFDEKRHVVDEVPKRYEKLTVGVDAGSLNPCVFLLAGKIGNRWYFLDEMYHDGRKDKQKTNVQYVADMDSFFQRNGLSKGIQVVIDPSAADLKLELLNHGYDVVGANNAVLRGIQKVSSLISSDNLIVHRKCKNLIYEKSSYSWDEKKSILSGKDEVKKEHDHCSDAERYIINTELGGLA